MAGSGKAPDGTWKPVFAGQRPPLEPGHTLTLHHGARSPRVLEPRAAEIAAAALADPATAYLSEPAYEGSVRLWAMAQGRAELVGEWLDAKPIDEQLKPPKGGAVPPIEVWRKLAETALHAADRLGLTPLSRARLGRDVTAARFDLAKLWAEEAAEDGD